MSSSAPWEPVSRTDRYSALDVLRGVALLGVLLVNLLTLFRVSLFTHILTFHTHPGWPNRSVDILTAWLLEFKAFTLFSFLFGVGVCIQAERARSHSVRASRFLVRRFLVLLAIGLCHMFLIWNGDILTLYAACGLMLLPFIDRKVRTLMAFGFASIALMFVPIFGTRFPGEATLRVHAAAATRIYSEGSFGEILALRWHESWRLMAPLLIGTLPRTFGLMLLGIAAWRAGILKGPAQHRRFLLTVLIGGGVCGAIATTLVVRSESTGRPLPLPPVLLQAVSHIPLAFAFGSGLLLWQSSTVPGLITQLFAAAGRMALSNYLAQSIIFSLLFYGFGFGLFGRLGPAVAAMIGIAIYVGQLATSYLWLLHYRFGPAEWLWRSLSYGRRQPMKLATTQCAASSPIPS